MDSLSAPRRLGGGISNAHRRAQYTLAFFVTMAAAQQDPINNFCRRFGHQTAVVDNRLYIDGGLVNWSPMSTYPGNYTNTWLLYQDLTQDSDEGMPQIYASLNKNSSVPDVSGGYLWADEVNKYLYLFGGEYYQTPPPSTFLLYAYDILNDFWVARGALLQASIAPVSYGAGTTVSERGEGYYYGGWVSNASQADWTGVPRATTALVKYDMDTGTWSSTVGPDTVRRAEGSMVFVPAGDGGLLVYFGGVTDPHGNGTAAAQSLDTIFVYDVVSAKWYTQQATGTIPGDRRRFCAGVAWAPDRSSYNIYMYGGAGLPPHTAGYDDLYVLTMPAFEWIRLYPSDGNTTGGFPHHSLTCNVVAGAQMLIIGGTFPASPNYCDAPSVWGTHNVDLTAAFDGEPAVWKLFATNETTYQVPDAVYSVVGGGPAGSATKTAPADGWDSADLEVLMTRTATLPSRTATRAVTTDQPSSSTHLSGGAIAGVAIGSVAGVALLAFVSWVFARRYRRRRLQAGGGGTIGGTDGITGGGNGGSGKGPGLGIGSPFSAGSPQQQHMYDGAGGQFPLAYSDAPTPAVGPGGSGSPYYHTAQLPPAAPVELAASSGSGYTHLSPGGTHMDSRSNTWTSTGSSAVNDPSSAVSDGHPRSPGGDSVHVGHGQGEGGGSRWA